MLFASIAAIATPSIIMIIIFLALDAPPSAILILVIILYGVTISTAHFVLLGLPSLILLKKLNILSLKHVTLAGFLIASIPWSIYGWPNTSPTTEDWLAYIKFAIAPGILFGIPAGLAFWYFYD